MLSFSIQHTDSHRTKHLVSGKCQKVHVQILHIHRHMRNALSAICHNSNSSLMADPGKCFDIIFHAQHIGYLCNGNNLRMFRNRISQIFFGDLTLLVTFYIFHNGSRSFCCLLPRKHIAVMFHNADQDLITRLKHQISIAVRNQIQAFRCISGKNNLVRTFGMNKLTHPLSCPLVLFRRCLCKVIKSSQRIGIAVLIKISDRIDHFIWLLGGCRAVKIDEFLILKNGKIFSYFLYIKVPAHFPSSLPDIPVPCASSLHQ